MISMYTTFIYAPLYNGLIFLMDVIPWADAGVAVIIFTIIVKLILFPLSYRSVKTQLEMKRIEPELNAVKQKYTDKQEQARAIMALYKEKNINPFSGFFLILIQLPIIFALYSIFYNGGLPSVHGELLYSFVAIPDFVNMEFLGLLDIAKKSVILSLLAAATQYFQIRYSMPIVPKKTENATFKDDLARTMSLQMRYMLPVVVFFISYSISSVIALYWTVSNLFAIGQELYIRKTLKNNKTT